MRFPCLPPSSPHISFALRLAAAWWWDPWGWWWHWNWSSTLVLISMAQVCRNSQICWLKHVVTHILFGSEASAFADWNPHSSVIHVITCHHHTHHEIHWHYCQLWIPCKQILYLVKNCTNPLLVDTQKIVLVGSPLPKIHRLLLCPIGVLEVPFRDLPMVLSDKRPELA